MAMADATTEMLVGAFALRLTFDETRAVEPLERTPHWASGEPPETFPTGM